MIYKDDRLGFYWHEGILVCEYYVKKADAEFVEFGINKRLEITGDKPCVMISDISKVKSSTREARENMGNEKAKFGINAVALVINSKVQEVMYKFFLALYSQPTDIRVFSNIQEAIDWIKPYIPKDSAHE